MHRASIISSGTSAISIALFKARACLEPGAGANRRAWTFVQSCERRISARLGQEPGQCSRDEIWPAAAALGGRMSCTIDTGGAGGEPGPAAGAAECDSAVFAEPVRILLVDDHMVVRAGLAQVIGSVPGLVVVAEAENGEEALFQCQRHRPDVVLMDVRMQGMGGIAATEAMCKYHPNVAVIALSSFADPPTVARMLAAGARGFLPKSVSASDLSVAIRKVHDGETVVDPGCLPQVATAFDPTTPGEDDLELSAQQRRGKGRRHKGDTNPEKAKHQGISKPTARC